MKRIGCFLTIIFLMLMNFPTSLYAQNDSASSRNQPNDCSFIKMERFANKGNRDKEFYVHFWAGWERRVEMDSDLRSQLEQWGPPTSDARLIDNLRKICRQYPTDQGTGKFVADIQMSGRKLLSVAESEESAIALTPPAAETQPTPVVVAELDDEEDVPEILIYGQSATRPGPASIINVSSNQALSTNTSNNPNSERSSSEETAAPVPTNPANSESDEDNKALTEAKRKVETATSETQDAQSKAIRAAQALTEAKLALQSKNAAVLASQANVKVALAAQAQAEAEWAAKKYKRDTLADNATDALQLSPLRGGDGEVAKQALITSTAATKEAADAKLEVAARKDAAQLLQKEAQIYIQSAADANLEVQNLTKKAAATLALAETKRSAQVEAEKDLATFPGAAPGSGTALDVNDASSPPTTATDTSDAMGNANRGSPSTPGENAGTNSEVPNEQPPNTFYQFKTDDKAPIDELISDKDLKNSLAEVIGVSYPDKRLMEKAFESLPNSSKLDEFGDIVNLTQKSFSNRNLDQINVETLAHNCGCTENLEEDPIVYAFYPINPALWPDIDNSPQIDFELIDRIAIDGLKLKKDGSLDLTNKYWRKDIVTNYIEFAHKHRGKIDLAIHLPDLQGWTDQRLDRAANSIVRELSRFDRPRLGFDGVTLILKEYNGGGRKTDIALAEDRNSRAERIVFLVDILKQEIDKNAQISKPKIIDKVSGNTINAKNKKADLGQTKSINLAFYIDLSEDIRIRKQGLTYKPQKLFADIGTLIVKPNRPSDDKNVQAKNQKKKSKEPTEEIHKPNVDKILVFLERPTSDAKKALRSRIENSFKGKNRERVLRSIIPVLPPVGHKAVPTRSNGDPFNTDPYAQLIDDLVYFDDNFSGVGYWPAPFVSTSPDYLKVKELTTSQFDEERWHKSKLDGVCRIICPNRILVIKTVSILLATVLALAVLSHFYLPVYTIAYKRFVIHGLVAIAIGLLTAVRICDKQGQWAGWAIFSILVLVCSVFGYNWYNKQKSGPTP